MKKKLLAAAAVFIMMICSGCGETSENKDYDRNAVQNNTPYSELGYNESSYSEPEQEQHNDYNDYDDYDDYGDDDWLDDLTYGDFVVLCRDDIINDAADVTYQQLARSTTGMEGEFVKFKGEIIQVVDDTDGNYECYVILMNITYNPDDFFPYYSDTVIVEVMKDFMNERPLVNDIVTVWGMSAGLVSYESVLGDVKTEPSVIAAKVQLDNSY